MPHQRYRWLRVSVILGLLAGMALSPKLWLSARAYPLTPVWSGIGALGPPADGIVLGVLIALLVAAIFVPRRGVILGVFALFALLAAQDQSRWQPWAYQYVLMLAAIALAGKERKAAALNTCCLIIAATYFWSGLAKFNPRFASNVFPALAETLLGPKLAALPLVHRLAVIPPLLECGAGAGLLFRRFRAPAAACAIAMHVYILAVLGSRQFNPVVWPWNAAMIVFLLILFLRREKEFRTREIVWGHGFAFQKIVLVLFGLMPGLSFFGVWDHYLSSALYSGNRTSGVVYLDDSVFDRLPSQLQDYVTDEGANRGRLDINEWSLSEMNVPSYPEPRVYRHVAARLCSLAAAKDGMELVVDTELTLVNRNRKAVYRCADLPRN
jgi:hypothetical protein